MTETKSNSNNDNSNNNSKPQLLNTAKYKREVKNVPFGKNRTILIETYTPILSEKEMQSRERELENTLFWVVGNYEKVRKNQ